MKLSDAQQTALTAISNDPWTKINGRTLSSLKAKGLVREVASATGFNLLELTEEGTAAEAGPVVESASDDQLWWEEKGRENLNQVLYPFRHPVKTSAASGF